MAGELQKRWGDDKIPSPFLGESQTIIAIYNGSNPLRAHRDICATTEGSGIPTCCVSVTGSTLWRYTLEEQMYPFL